jgi:hypothetical protein
MSDKKLVRAITLSGFRDVVENVECVHLRHLQPFTTLLVRTLNSLYRVVITDGPSVSVQGGAFFPEATSAYLGGASTGGAAIRVGCICVGLRVEIHAGDQVIVTSPVRAITHVRASDRVAAGSDAREPDAGEGLPKSH